MEILNLREHFPVEQKTNKQKARRIAKTIAIFLIKDHVGIHLMESHGMERKIRNIQYLGNKALSFLFVFLIKLSG